MYDDSERRYRNEPAFHTAVEFMRRMAHEHGFTPGELRQIAFYAALLVEMHVPEGTKIEVTARLILPAGNVAAEGEAGKERGR